MMPHGVNEAAFPFIESANVTSTQHIHPGMSLLDYFAAAALTGLLAQHRGSEGETAMIDMEPAYQGWNLDDVKLVAKSAYNLADEMLAVREKRYLDQVDAEA